MRFRAHPRRSTIDAIGQRCIAGWLKRWWGAMLADVEPVDSSSLEVLLYCPDDLAMRGEVPSRHIDRVEDR